MGEKESIGEITDDIQDKKVETKTDEEDFEIHYEDADYSNLDERELQSKKKEILDSLIEKIDDLSIKDKLDYMESQAHTLAIEEKKRGQFYEAAITECKIAARLLESLDQNDFKEMQEYSKKYLEEGKWFIGFPGAHMFTSNLYKRWYLSGRRKHDDNNDTIGFEIVHEEKNLPGNIQMTLNYWIFDPGYNKEITKEVQRAEEEFKIVWNFINQFGENNLKQYRTEGGTKWENLLADFLSNANLAKEWRDHYKEAYLKVADFLEKNKGILKELVNKEKKELYGS